MILINAIGFSNSGKTILLEALAAHYVSEGVTVAAIKDIHGEDFRPDEEGKDTWRLAQAGATPVVGHSLHDTIFHWPQFIPLLEVISKITAEVILVEGFKNESMPRIVCARDVGPLATLVDADTYCITGPISDEMQEYDGIPVLSARHDLPQIINLAELHSIRYEL
ncbi:MAG TPA: molybdopterin-guanine dinucleotide biosynthesis protein B [Candidatus Lokiarchaeia archaeon]|nr:molybdopterin-guanine dinucleotide biosynthesis protein B [Candidatus Lokiarchaeia archaeon]